MFELKKDAYFVILQFLLFALFFIDWGIYIGIVFPFWLDYLLIFCICVGFFIILMGILNMNENISPFPVSKKRSDSISHGIYAYIRHPVYLGIMIAMVAYALYTTSYIKLLISGALIIVLYFKTTFEEKQLIRNFEEYKEYKKQTGRFFPKLRNTFR